ncbi:MAG TPA: hypothetical protein ENK57_11145 [Polyangiaceae bacterium]|nr:hypothetical protein [Polyangiaceae bacterium]
MDRDLHALDDALAELLLAHRRAKATLERDPGARVDTPLRDSPLLHPELFHELGESTDPLAAALVPWLEVLLDERWAWTETTNLSALRTTPASTPHLDDPTPIRSMIRGTLAASARGARRDFAAALCATAAELSARAASAVEARRERAGGGRFGDVVEMETDAIATVAEAVLDRTDDLTADAMRQGWVEGMHATLGRAADEGWPAKLTWRWTGEVLGDAGWSDGLSLALSAPPRPWGGASFGRALGEVGAALLVAARPRTLPRALHGHPFGLRRHRAYGLFAAIVTSATFAQRVLGLGRDRADAHARAMSTAHAAALRVDAMRVLVTGALAAGRGAADERLAEVSERLFGEPLPAATLAVLPQLRPAQSAAFVGSVLSFADRQALVERHDLDWFRNPRAAAELRDAFERPADLTPLPADAAARALEALGEALEAPF